MIRSELLAATIGQYGDLLRMRSDNKEALTLAREIATALATMNQGELNIYYRRTRELRAAAIHGEQKRAITDGNA